MDESTRKARIEKSLAMECSAASNFRESNELFQGTVTLMTAVYGSASHPVAILRETAKVLDYGNKPMDMPHIAMAARGALRNRKGEMEAGFLGSLRQRMIGDVLTDFLHLARTVLDDPSDKAKNIAAVLAAAAKLARGFVPRAETAPRGLPLPGPSPGSGAADALGRSGAGPA